MLISKRQLLGFALTSLFAAGLAGCEGPHAVSETPWLGAWRLRGNNEQWAFTKDKTGDVGGRPITWARTGSTLHITFPESKTERTYQVLPTPEGKTMAFKPAQGTSGPTLEFDRQ